MVVSRNQTKFALSTPLSYFYPALSLGVKSKILATNNTILEDSIMHTVALDGRWLVCVEKET